MLEARLTDGEMEMMFAVKSGKAIRFHESHVRAIGRTGSGVRAMTLAGPKDEVIGMIVAKQGEQDIMVVSQNGYGKRSVLDDYRMTNRGGKGVKTINITEKTGELIAIKAVTDDDDLMIITEVGIAIRLSVSTVRVMGRNTQGVKLINLREDDHIAAATQVPSDNGEEAVENPESGEAVENSEIKEATEPTEDKKNESENTGQTED